MTLNDFLEAIAAVLTALWPDRTVEVDEIPSGADGNFYVGIAESDQEKKLGRRRRRSIQFQVLYFLETGDNMAYNEWAESMYENFERLTVADGENSTRIVHLKGLTARKDDDGRFFQFLFSVDALILKAPEEDAIMENLTMSEGLKHGEQA